MSDGMNDSRALDDLAGKVVTAAHELAEALKSARHGHRGLAVGGLAEIVNRQLESTSFRLVERQDPYA